ncbi:MAG: aspartyl-tRNA(Asn)/glutamyl-tRNA(Gln) amidotransferase subunit A [Gammaproteobacteria bacterium]|jgi:aspartyl-tRNA(Asn)/glutamyl-tRNA(Gln) amidotransferase subunit A
MSAPCPSIAEARALLASRALSPVELTNLCLSRIEVLDPKLNSFMVVTAERALDDARRAEAEISYSGPRSAIHGIPIGLKDIIDTAEIETTYGSRWFVGHIPTTDATCVTRLVDAGAVLIGKLTTHEFADGGPSFDLPWPPARNPWDLDHFTGGSSSGTAAAVAGGLIPAGLGSDTGGSIRGPSAFCGIAGIKPTYGLVSRFGVAPAAYSLDHIGPMAWTSEDCALLLQSLAGYDAKDPASADRPVPDYSAKINDGVKGLRVGVIHHFHETDHVVSPATREATDNAIAVLRELGAEVREATLSPLADWAACCMTISAVERAAAYEELAREDLSRFSIRVQKRLQFATLFSGVDYVQAIRRRRELRDEMTKAMSDCDILLTAASPGEAPPINAVPIWDVLQKPSFTNPCNVSGFPAISICAGFGKGGLPVAIQLIAKPFQEDTLFRAAHAFETATEFRAHRPLLDDEVREAI